MSEVHKIASLHPKTVTNYRQHVKTPSRNPGRVNVLVYVKVDIRVWRVALKLAKGDRTRLVVRSETEVSVLNPIFSKKHKVR